MAHYLNRVVVKFRSSVSLPYRDGVEDVIRDEGIGPWSTLVAKYPGITVERMFRRLSVQRMQALLDRAEQMDPDFHDPDLFHYFAVRRPESVDAKDLARDLRLWDSVEHAEVEGGPGRPPAGDPKAEPEQPNQRYEDPTRWGIDAEFAWTLPGGKGEGVRLADVEQGWYRDHD